MSIATRLLTTAFAGLAGFTAVGIYVLLTGAVENYVEAAGVLILFTLVYVPGIFGARRLLAAYFVRTLETLPAQAHHA